MARNPSATACAPPNSGAHEGTRAFPPYTRQRRRELAISLLASRTAIELVYSSRPIGSPSGRFAACDPSVVDQFAWRVSRGSLPPPCHCPPRLIAVLIGLVGPSTGSRGIRPVPVSVVATHLSICRVPLPRRGAWAAFTLRRRIRRVGEQLHGDHLVVKLFDITSSGSGGAAQSAPPLVQAMMSSSSGTPLVPLGLHVVSFLPAVLETAMSISLSKDRFPDDRVVFIRSIARRG